MKADNDPRSIRMEEWRDREGIELPYANLGDLITYLNWCADQKMNARLHVQEGALREVIGNLLALELSHAVKTME